MVGYKFMGRAHSHAYRDLSFFFHLGVEPVLQAISGRDEAGVRAAAEQLGWASYETDWRRLIERDDIDVIDIGTPNHTHAEIAIAAAQAGKHVICEKPLALNLADARRMLEAVEAAGVVHMVCHNYRFAPAVQWAKRLIESGRLGRIHHVRAAYLQDWLLDPEHPMDWHLTKETAGSGALGDIGSHIIDLARFLVGEIAEVVGVQSTFVQRRPYPKSQPGQPAEGEVTVDDATAFLARFNDGALGVFEATRFAGGNRNKNRFEINGEKGSIRWDLERMNELEVYFTDDEEGLQGFRTINCTEPAHPYAGAYWPPGHIIGYEHTFLNLLSEFFQGVRDGRAVRPNFVDGVRNQAVMEAVEKSVASGRWESVEE
jgi:predicted dehydrogenase